MDIVAEKIHDERPLNVLAGVICFTTCMLIHHAISYALFSKLLPAYSTLSYRNRMEWDSRVVSTIHAALVTVLSVYSLATEPELWEGKLKNTSQLAGVTLGISAAYMLADGLSMTIYWRDINLFIYGLHHAIAASCFMVCAQQGVLQFFALFRLTSELSTPFLNQSWFNKYAQVNKGSWLSLLNSICLTGCFCLCRLSVIPFYWFYFLQAAASTGGVAVLAQQLGWNFWLWLIGSAILDLMNLNWAKKIVGGGVRTAKTGLKMRGVIKSD